MNRARVIWDLSDLFLGPDDPEIDRALVELKRSAESFAARYQGKVHEAPDPDWLRQALVELEGIEAHASRVSSYADLLYAADTSSQEAKNLEQKVEQKITEIENLLLFFEIEWLDVPEDRAKRLWGDPSLDTYRHYLKSMRRYRRHKLTLAEEKIANEKDNTGRRAFGRLFTELNSSLMFPLEWNGEKKELTASEVLALFYQPERELRRRASETLFEVLSRHGLVLTFIYDTILQDHLTMDRLRRYEHPMEERHLRNEIDAKAVQRMMEVTETNYSAAQDYFRLKARFLGLERLALYDQYAPVTAEVASCDFSKAREIILQAFGAFSPGYAKLASRFFEERWIDAEIRPGKRGGAFCSSSSPYEHPYILCNYNDHMRDVMTVAHELGHGLHGMLARVQTPFNYHPPLTTAETASVFGEMLVFDHLLKSETDPRTQLALLSGKIEDIFATVFRQNLMTRFEEAAFYRRKEARLSGDVLGELWLDANRRYYGNEVELPEGYRWGWSYIPHFIHSRFYCYSYVFGELLVLALYRMYKEEGESFVAKYTRLLEAGGSDEPEALLGRLGVDIRDPGFWQKGFLEIRRLVDQAREV